MKKLLTIIITASMLLVPVSFNASAEEFVGINNLLYDDFSGGVISPGIILNKGLVTTETLDSGEEVLKLAAEAKKGAQVTVKSYSYNQSGNPVVNDFMKPEEGALPELILEYRVKVNNTSNYSYFAYQKTGTSAKTLFYANKSYKHPGVFFWGMPTGSGADDYRKFAVDPDAIFDFAQWHTVVLKYSNTDKTRSLYVDGVYYGTSNDSDDTNTNPWFEKGKTNFVFYEYNYVANDYVLIDYVRVYTPGEEFSAAAGSESYDLREIMVEFNSSVNNITPDMFEIDGKKPVSVELYDASKQKYKLIFDEAFAHSTSYSLSVNGVTDVLGRTFNDSVDFETRTAEFYISDLKLSNGVSEAEFIVPGDSLYLEGKINNECVGEKAGVVAATQYDADGFMIKDKLFKVPFNADNNGVVISEDIEVDLGSEAVEVFAWESMESPVPLSDFKTYSGEGISKGILNYKAPSLSDTPSVEAVIKEDYSGMTVTVNTGDYDYNRLVGLLVKYNGETDYIKNGIVKDGKAVFDVPLKEEQVGDYSVIAGIENGGIICLENDIEFYSPVYIEKILETNINSVDADAVSVGEFVDILGNYLKLDMTELNLLDDKSIAYNKIISIRDSSEDKLLSYGEELSNAFSSAVKMALIYEGKNTAEIITGSSELALDEQTLETFGTLINAEAREYVAEKLKGKEYADISDMSGDIKLYSIIGGLYKASHYSLADTFIGIYGDEMGINISKYNSLKSPEAVANKVIGTEYSDFDKFADAVNKAISTQAAKEAQAQQSSSPSRGGGGGGNRISGTTYTPDKKEEVKEEVKEEKPIKSYSDVTDADWFYNDVMWATGEGMFIGTSETTFSPSMNLTWEQIAIVLKRIGHTLDNKNGSADISRGDFAEVLYNFLADKAQYKTRDEWIAGTKIFIGDQNGDMMFEKTLTRAECCTVLRRISK